MRRSLLPLALSGLTLTVALVAAGCSSKKVDAGARASELAQRLILLDGHVDLPDRIQGTLDKNGNITEDISQRTEKGDFDWPRAKAGGLDAPFMSIYVPADKEDNGAKEYAEKLIHLVETFA